MVQFLDEADLLADNIAILAAPGKLVAEGSPVTLKSSLGKGYTVSVAFSSVQAVEKRSNATVLEVLQRIQSVAPNATLSSSTTGSAWFALNAKDVKTVEKVLDLLDREQDSLGIASFDVHGASLEDIFLALMKQHGQGLEEPSLSSPPIEDVSERKSDSVHDVPKILRLTNGRRRRPLAQALTIFHKRWLIARRSWLTPVLAVVIAVCGSCIPLFFLDKRSQTCERIGAPTFAQPLFLPDSSAQLIATFVQNGTSSSVVTVPPGLLDTLGASTSTVQTTDVQDNQTFVQDIQQNFMNLSIGGLSLDLTSGQSLVAWEATPPGFLGPVMLNLASNILFNRALNNSGAPSGNATIIGANYQMFPGIAAGTLSSLRWTAFFGAAMVGVLCSFCLVVTTHWFISKILGSIPRLLCTVCIQ
jgi:hypothetical protein